MLFGEDSLKGLKKELKSTDADMSLVKKWQKTYDKVKKSSGLIEAQYVQAKTELEQVRTILKKMEQASIMMKGDLQNPSYKALISECARDLKKYQGHFNQEFLIGKEDKEFHLTYQTLLSLCTKGFQETKDVLILQSEVENILAVTDEALAKEWPDMRAMAYFYLDRSDKEIYDLPHSDKVTEVAHIYEAEFLSPIREVLVKKLGEERARQILEVELW